MTGASTTTTHYVLNPDFVSEDAIVPMEPISTYAFRVRRARSRVLPNDFDLWQERIVAERELREYLG